jgi:hypothetical protein
MVDTIAVLLISGNHGYVVGQKYRFHIVFGFLLVHAGSDRD